jgi:hypothetical protein
VSFFEIFQKKYTFCEFFQKKTVGYFSEKVLEMADQKKRHNFLDGIFWKNLEVHFFIKGVSFCEFFQKKYTFCEIFQKKTVEVF